MKKMFCIITMLIISFGLTACSTSETNERKETNGQEVPISEFKLETDEVEMSNQLTMIEVNITIGDEVFLARLYDTQTTQAFVEKLPLSRDMEDLHSNEKFYYFSDTLPTDSKRQGNINAGDIMLYGDNCLVLFYESLSGSFSYTRLGYIEDTERFTQALGSGSVEVTFTLSE